MESAEAVRHRNKGTRLKDYRLTKQQAQDVAYMRGYLAASRHAMGLLSKNPYTNQRCFNAWFRGWNDVKYSKALYEVAFEIDCIDAKQYDN